MEALAPWIKRTDARHKCPNEDEDDIKEELFLRDLVRARPHQRAGGPRPRPLLRREVECTLAGHNTTRRTQRLSHALCPGARARVHGAGNVQRTRRDVCIAQF